MATATDPAASQIANMVANALFEVSGCLDKLGKAILSTTEGGQLSKGTVEPKRATRTKAGKKARKQNKDGQPRRTRKPSTYNLFMKKTMQELKESGFSSPESNGLFRAAIDQWKEMDAAAKKAWTDAHADELAAYGSALAAGRATPEPLPADPEDDDLAKEGATARQDAAENQAPEDSPAAPTPAAPTPAAEALVPGVGSDADKPKKKKKKKRHHDKDGNADPVDGEKKHRKKAKKSKSDGDAAAP